MKSWTKKLLPVLLVIIILLIATYVYILKNGIWRNETGNGFLWMQPAVFGFDNFGTATYKDGVLYAPSKGDDNVYAIDALNGQITWQSTVRQCDASPCIDEESIYVGEVAPSAKALALNKTTGKVIWQFVDPGKRSWVGSPLVHEDLVFYTTQGSGVYALNKSNGDPIWHQNIGSLVCSAAYHNGVVFCVG